LRDHPAIRDIELDTVTCRERRGLGNREMQMLLWRCDYVRLEPKVPALVNRVIDARIDAGL